MAFSCLVYFFHNLSKGRRESGVRTHITGELFIISTGNRHLGNWNMSSKITRNTVEPNFNSKWSYYKIGQPRTTLIQYYTFRMLQESMKDRPLVQIRLIINVPIGWVSQFSGGTQNLRHQNTAFMQWWTSSGPWLSKKAGCKLQQEIFLQSCLRSRVDE